MADTKDPLSELDSLLQRLLEDVEAKEASAGAKFRAAELELDAARRLRAKYNRLLHARRAFETGDSASDEVVGISAHALVRLESPPRARQATTAAMTTRARKFKDLVLHTIASMPREGGATAADVAAVMAKRPETAHLSQRALYSMTYIALRRLVDARLLSEQPGLRGRVFLLGGGGPPAKE